MLTRDGPILWGGVLGWRSQAQLVQVVWWDREYLQGTNPSGTCGVAEPAVQKPCWAVSWGMWGKWGGCFTYTSAGFSQVPPASAGPLDRVQSSCVRLNSSRDKVRLSFSRKVFEVCCQDGVLLQIINVSCITDHPESSLRTWLCFETPVRLRCHLVPAVGTSCLGSSADAMCCWWVFFLLSWESVLLQYIVWLYLLSIWETGVQASNPSKTT